jgi:hypothetical protein
MQRTNEQIKERIRLIQIADLLGYETMTLIEALPWDEAKEFLGPMATREGWEETCIPYSIASVKQQLIAFIPFARSYVIDEAEEDAVRAQAYFRGWMWLLGDDILIEYIEAIPYRNYGLHRINQIEEYYKPNDEN